MKLSQIVRSLREIFSDEGPSQIRSRTQSCDPLASATDRELAKRIAALGTRMSQIKLWSPDLRMPQFCWHGGEAKNKKKK